MFKQTTFGSFLREKRIVLRIGLREMCQKLSYDPSNYSKLERDALMPPQSADFLEKIANIFKIKKGSLDFDTLFDLADLARGQIPSDIRNQKNITPLLPAFFRTIRREKPTREELIRIIERIRKI